MSKRKTKIFLFEKFQLFQYFSAPFWSKGTVLSIKSVTVCDTEIEKLNSVLNILRHGGGKEELSDDRKKKFAPSRSL